MLSKAVNSSPGIGRLFHCTWAVSVAGSLSLEPRQH